MPGADMAATGIVCADSGCRGYRGKTAPGQSAGAIARTGGGRQAGGLSPGDVRASDFRVRQMLAGVCSHPHATGTRQRRKPVSPFPWC